MSTLNNRIFGDAGNRGAGLAGFRRDFHQLMTRLVTEQSGITMSEIGVCYRREDN